MQIRSGLQVYFRDALTIQHFFNVTFLQQTFYLGLPDMESTIIAI